MPLIGALRNYTLITVNTKTRFSLTKSNTTVVSLQHASGYDYGDNFFFIDYSDDDRQDGYQDKDFTVSGIQHLAYQKSLAVISHTAQLLMWV